MADSSHSQVFRDGLLDGQVVGFVANQPQALAAGDACGDLDRQLPQLFDGALTVALGARFGDDATAAACARASS
mgnify:CR=1 FL=1